MNNNDAAVKFHTTKFLVGTAHLGHAEIGGYILLLCHQQQKKILSLDFIKGILGQNFDTTWPKIKDKFVETPEGYYNDRMDYEATKTERYTKSRRQNLGVPNRFVKPTAEEVQRYCDERGNGISGQTFVDFYDQKGWVVGKGRTPMKDWRAAVRTWENSRREQQKQTGGSKFEKISDTYSQASEILKHGQHTGNNKA